MENKEGWSDSTIRTTSLTIHYYKNGKSLCGKSYLDSGNIYFDKEKKSLSDRYSYHCKICIRKQNKI